MFATVKLGGFTVCAGGSKARCAFGRHIALRQVQTLTFVPFGAGDKFPIVATITAVAVKSHAARNSIAHARIVDVVAGGGAVVAATGIGHIAIRTFPAVIFI